MQYHNSEKLGIEIECSAVLQKCYTCLVTSILGDTCLQNLKHTLLKFGNCDTFYPIKCSKIANWKVKLPSRSFIHRHAWEDIPAFLHSVGCYLM